VVTKVHEVIPYDYARLSKSKNIFNKIKYILFRTGLLDPNYLFMLKFSDWIIVSNEEHQRFLEDYFPHTKSKIKLILSGINVEPISDLDGQYRKKIRQDLRVSDSEIIFSFLGFIIVRKGIDTLIYALKDLIRSNHKIKLLIIGGREHLGKEDINFVEEMDALIKNLGLKEHVTWTGYCSHKEVSSYLLASDVCVLPFDEGVSLKRMSFITAVAHSLPLITTKGETLSKMLVDGENVVLVPPKNPHALASAMLNLVSSKELRHKLSVSALKLAEQFSWDKYVDKFISLYSMGS
jgi:glycosyltransferase involved in cell wall biosynthesis